MKTFVKNVSSSTSHKKTPTLWEFKKSLSNTLIYELILIKIYVNANIMNRQIFHIIKYDLKQSLKVTKSHFYVYFIVNLGSYGQLFALVFVLCWTNSNNYSH